MGDKTVRASHLIYIIIIAVIVLSFFLVIAFGGMENAGTIMGTASTVSSLILSVIAIVLSLIDVAGQKQSMVDLKETAEKLQESNEDSQKLIEHLVQKITDIDLLKQELSQQIESNETWKADVKDLISNGNKEDLTKEELQKRLEEIIEKEKQNYITIDLIKKYNNILVNLNNPNQSTLNTSVVQASDVKKLVNKLLNLYQIEQIVSRTELFKIIKELELKSPARKLINNLVENYFLEPITNEGIDRKYVIKG